MLSIVNYNKKYNYEREKLFVCMCVCLLNVKNKSNYFGFLNNLIENSKIKHHKNLFIYLKEDIFLLNSSENYLLQRIELLNSNLKDAILNVGFMDFYKKYQTENSNS